jgi:hypothetical protein
VSRLIQGTALVVAVAVASPVLIALSHALIPLIVTIGVVVALLRVVFWYCR